MLYSLRQYQKKKRYIEECRAGKHGTVGVVIPTMKQFKQAFGGRKPERLTERIKRMENYSPITQAQFEEMIIAASCSVPLSPNTKVVIIK